MSDPDAERTDGGGRLPRRRLLVGGAIAGAGLLGAGAWALRPAPVGASPGWRQRAPMPAARGEMKAAALDGDVYVPGGLSGAGSATDRVARYDAGADEWTALASLPAPRNHHATVAVDGRVFVLGGNASFEDPPDDAVFAYDPDADAWERRTPMPDGRWGHDAVALDGTVYAVGGASREGSADVLAYDPTADEWERRAPLSTAREHLAAAVVDGTLYAAGGRWDGENLPDVTAYDPAVDAWREVEPVPTPRSGTVGATLDGRLHVLGGENPATVGGWVTDAHEVYDPEGGGWSGAPRLPLGLHGAAGATVDGRLFVFGGAWRHGPWSVTAWSARTFVYEP